MRVFLTGATGLLGSAIIPNLLAAGHQVLGLARSKDSAKSLIAEGAEAHLGDLEDLGSLRRGAEQLGGVIHTAFNHDFSVLAKTCEIDRVAIETFGEVLKGSDRPLVVTAGLAPLSKTITTEEDTPPPDAAARYPRVSEQTAIALVGHGVRSMVVRVPQVHDAERRQGFATRLMTVAREKGVSAYVGEGTNRWATVHRLDAAALFDLVLAKGAAGFKYHAVAEEGVAVRSIAEAIGRGLQIPVVSLSPEEAARHFDATLAGRAGADVDLHSLLRLVE
jgi:nucleoside-diphosphate-sugar epimerase